MSRKPSTVKSFTHAIDGVKTAIKNEPNFRLHLLAAILAIMGGIYFKLERLEWIILTITISLVIILELVNTSLEALVDLASPKIHPLAKIAKDVSASAVLIAAVSALVIGLFLFLPKII